MGSDCLETTIVGIKPGPGAASENNTFHDESKKSTGPWSDIRWNVAGKGN
jgi:hypothetical protein